jgi:hypothetical protein
MAKHRFFKVGIHYIMFCVNVKEYFNIMPHVVESLLTIGPHVVATVSTMADSCTPDIDTKTVGLRRGNMGFTYVRSRLRCRLDNFSGGYQDFGICSSKPVLHQRRPASSSVQVPVQVESSTAGTFGWPWRRSVADCDVAKGRAFDEEWWRSFLDW